MNAHACTYAHMYTPCACTQTSWNSLCADVGRAPRYIKKKKKPRKETGKGAGQRK